MEWLSIMPNETICDKCWRTPQFAPVVASVITIINNDNITVVNPNKQDTINKMWRNLCVNHLVILGKWFGAGFNGTKYPNFPKSYNEQKRLD